MVGRVALLWVNKLVNSRPRKFKLHASDGHWYITGGRTPRAIRLRISGDRVYLYQSLYSPQT